MEVGMMPALLLLETVVRFVYSKGPFTPTDHRKEEMLAMNQFPGLGFRTPRKAFLKQTGTVGSFVLFFT